VAQCKTTTPVMEQHGDVSVACLLVKWILNVE
jgi:hypothetical protein